MTVAFDAVASASVAGVGPATLTWTHTPVGTPTAVAVGLEQFTAIATTSGVTYGGVSMTKAVSQVITGKGTVVEIWGLPNPLSGAQSVVITSSAVAPVLQAGSVTVTGSDMATTFSNTASAEGNSTTPGVTVTSAAGELVVDVVGSTTANTTQTAGGSQAKRWGTLNAGSNSASGSTLAAVGASTAMSWTLSPSEPWGHAAASFKSAAGAAATYPQLERGIRGLHRGIAIGSY